MRHAGSFAGLPDDVRALLAGAPVADKALLELRVGWGGLAGARAAMAEALRVFVLTWDPLEWLGPRPDAFAAANVDPLELAVYVPTWSLAGAAGAGSAGPAVLGAVAGSAVVVAADHEAEILSGAYPREVVEGLVPPLLSERDAGAALGAPEVRLVSHGWEPIGLGAITDVVVEAFGPVALDRSPVELGAADRVDPACPACAGGRFGFPGELSEARDDMCPPHRARADTVIGERLEATMVSNPGGMGALGEACARLERPHLPNGLAGRLHGAEEAVLVQADPDRVATWARVLIDAAGWFEGRAEDLAVALGADVDLPYLPEWTMNIVPDLGRFGLGELAAEVGAAMARIDPAHASVYSGDVGVALAESGLAEAAQATIERNLATWPEDVWVRVHAGDALVALGDLDGAAAHFRLASEMACDTDDTEDLADLDAVPVVDERLADIERRRRKAQKAAGRDRPVTRVRPGDPCPCGSGSKYKHCHGRHRG